MLHAFPSVAQQLQSVSLRHWHALTSPFAAQAARRGAAVGKCLAWTRPTTACVEPTSSIRRDPRTARVEAVLFLANEPLGSRRIAQLASLADGTEARTLVRRLNQYYDSQDSAFRIEEIAGGFQMLTRAKFGGWLRRLHGSPVRTGSPVETGAPHDTRLSAPAMETLAVVAYRQAATRAEIEAVRGVQCGEMLRQLMERDLVRIVGRASDLGRPFLYGTTKRFLQWFGLRSLDELPRAELLRRAGPREQTQNAQPLDRGAASARYEIQPVEGRETKLTPSDSTEEHEVRIVPNLEPAREDLWKLAAVAELTIPQAVAEEDEDLDDEDDEWDDDEDDVDNVDDDEDDDDLDEDDDLEDDEWEEVDDEDDDWDDEEDDDWDDEDEDEDDEEDDEDDWDEEE
jgi:segregation and condensation protein B